MDIFEKECVALRARIVEYKSLVNCLRGMLESRDIQVDDLQKEVVKLQGEIDALKTMIEK